MFSNEVIVEVVTSGSIFFTTLSGMLVCSVDTLDVAACM